MQSMSRLTVLFLVMLLGVATTLCGVVSAAQDSGTPDAADLEMRRGVQADDASVLKAALAKGADINKKDASSGQTPLMQAVLGGKLAAVTYLLDSGADASLPEKVR